MSGLRAVAVSVIISLSPVALATDAGTVAPTQCPDAPLAVQVDGGYWLMAPERERRITCLLTECEAENTQLKATPTPWAWLAVSLAVGVGAGFAVGYYVKKGN